MSSVPLKVWDGTQWINIGVQGGTVLYQNEAPASPQTGMIWIDADSETSVLNDEDYLTLSTASATYAPSASPTFTGEVNLPATTNYNSELLSDTLASKLDLAGGKILQIVRATDTSDRTTTSTSAQDVTGLSVTITPQKADSAVILITNVRAYGTRSTTGDDRFYLFITDNSNNAISGAEAPLFGAIANATTNLIFYNPVMIAYATPATTSAVTYKTRFAVVNASNSLTLQNSVQTAQMFAIEVSA